MVAWHLECQNSHCHPLLGVTQTLVRHPSPSDVWALPVLQGAAVAPSDPNQASWEVRGAKGVSGVERRTHIVTRTQGAPRLGTPQGILAVRGGVMSHTSRCSFDLHDAGGHPRLQSLHKRYPAGALLD